MPNFATALKEEITRLARKELRSETEKLKKASAIYRSEIAALKRRLADLEKQALRHAKAAAKAEPEVAADAQVKHRFSAKRLQAMRQRLGLSAAEFGALVGVSAQTIYNWEAESTRPREQQLEAIAALRGAGKRAIAARLESVQAA